MKFLNEVSALVPVFSQHQHFKFLPVSIIVFRNVLSMRTERTLQQRSSQLLFYFARLQLSDGRMHMRDFTLC